MRAKLVQQMRPTDGKLPADNHQLYFQVLEVAESVYDEKRMIPMYAMHYFSRCIGVVNIRKAVPNPSDLIEKMMTFADQIYHDVLLTQEAIYIYFLMQEMSYSFKREHRANVLLKDPYVYAAVFILAHFLAVKYQTPYMDMSAMIEKFNNYVQACFAPYECEGEMALSELVEFFG
jgi:hypothetical protein